MSGSNLDRVRGAALDRIERSERNIKVAIGAAAVLEAGFLFTFVFLADLSNRLHVLLLLATFAIYSILAFGLIALGAHVNRCTERVLKAIEWSQAAEPRGRAAGSEK
jgi:hypothetical protein